MANYRIGLRLFSQYYEYVRLFPTPYLITVSIRIDSLLSSKLKKMYILRKRYIFIELHVTPMTKDTRPQLYTNDAKDKEDKETEQQNVAQHGECVQQEHH